MKNDELILIRNRQNELDCKIKKLQDAKNKILQLEQDSKVKEYLDLINFVSNNNEQKLQKQCSDNINKIVSYTRSSNKLLYDYGEILVRVYDGDDPYIIDEEHSLLRVYRDLETTEYYFLNIDEIELMPPDWRVVYSKQEDENSQKYQVLREYFIKELQTKSQEEVIEEILNRDKKLIKGK